MRNSNSQITEIGKNKPANAAAVVAPAPKVLRGQGNGDFTGARALLHIAPGNSDEDPSWVFVGAAGVGFQIPRGETWNVPIEVANVIKDAVETRWELKIVEGKEVRIPVARPRYMYTVQPAPEQVAVAA